MFALLGVSLLQPEELVARRLPGGADALGHWLQTLQAKLTKHYATAATLGCRSLTLAVGPNGPIDFWLAAEQTQPPVAEQAAIRELAAQVPCPSVTGGPIALTMVFSVGGEAPATAELAMPEAWRPIVETAGKPLSVDEILLRLQAARN
jgi:hypothetical protein